MNINKLIEKLQYLADQGHGEKEVMIWKQTGQKGTRYLTTVEELTQIKNTDNEVSILLL